MSSRGWNTAVAVAPVAYLAAGTVLLGKAMNAEGASGSSFDFCDLVWLAAVVIAVVFEIPVAIVGTWLGHTVRARTRRSG
jgi:hypothetical protein